MNTIKNKSPLNTLFGAIGDKEFMKGFFEQTKMSLMWLLKSAEDNFDHGNNAPTVLLCHGLWCTNKAMESLWECLREWFNVAYAPNFSLLNTWDMSTSAGQLWRKIQFILDTYETNWDLHILSHSTWWLIALQALLGGKGKQVNSLTTCATPFQWAPIAKLAFPSKAAAQINAWFLGDNIPPIDSIQSLYMRVAMSATWIPPQSQELDIDIFPQHTIYHHDFTHTSFIVWEKKDHFAKKYMSSISA